VGVVTGVDVAGIAVATAVGMVVGGAVSVTVGVGDGRPVAVAVGEGVALAISRVGVRVGMMGSGVRVAVGLGWGLAVGAAVGPIGRAQASTTSNIPAPSRNNPARGKTFAFLATPPPDS
jgi:hypothetical protein